MGYDVNGKEVYSDDIVLEDMRPDLGLIPIKRTAGDRIPVNRIGENFEIFELVIDKSSQFYLKTVGTRK